MSTKSVFVRLSTLLMIASVLFAACAPAAPATQAATAEPQVIINTVVVPATPGLTEAAEPV